MNAFNEWISTEQGKKIVQFSIKEQSSLFWVAGLFDIWENLQTKDKLISFALLTAPQNTSKKWDMIVVPYHDKLEQRQLDSHQKDEQESLNFLHKLPEVLDFTTNLR